MKHFSFSIIIYFCAIALLGFALLPSLKIGTPVDNKKDLLYISFQWPEHSPLVVEKEVTSKLESVLSRVEGVKGCESTSSQGSGTLILKLDKHASFEAIRLKIITSIRQLWKQIPKEVSFPSVTYNSFTGKEQQPLLTYFYWTKNINEKEVASFERIIRTQMATLKDIDHIDIQGNLSKVCYIKCRQEKMDILGIKPEDIANMLQYHTTKKYLGKGIEVNQKTTDIYLAGNKVNIEELKELPVQFIQGRIFRISDIADIIIQEQTSTIEHRLNGLKAIQVKIYGREGVNQIKLSKQIKHKMSEIKDKFFSNDKLILTSDQTINLNTEIMQTVFRLIGILAILLVLILLATHNLKYIFLLLISITVNYGISFLFYYLFNITIHPDSMMGIIIASGFVMNSLLIMADHIINCKRKNIFIAVLAATLTTLASLIIIIFSNEQEKKYLNDIGWILIINLSISLLTSLLFIPALAEKLNLTNETSVSSLKRRKQILHWNKLYQCFIAFLLNKKKFVFVLLIIIFGIPTFLLPDHITIKNKFASYYNEFQKSKINRIIREYIDPALGGTLRLFLTNTPSTYNHGSIQPQSNIINIQALFPDGCSFSEKDSTLQLLERILYPYRHILTYNTTFGIGNSAEINIQSSNKKVPNIMNRLYQSLVNKAILTGNATWEISMGKNHFNNHMSPPVPDYFIELKGYNYEGLIQQGIILKNELEKRVRVKNINILSEQNYIYNTPNTFMLMPQQQKLITYGITPGSLQDGINKIISKQIRMSIPFSYQNKLFDVIIENKHPIPYFWDFNNRFLGDSQNKFRIQRISSIDQFSLPQNIRRKDQQYNILIAYNFLGSPEIGMQIMKEEIEKLKNKLPNGYSVKTQLYEHNFEKSTIQLDFIFIILIILIIYIISCILFNSFLYPFISILTIPTAYIGLFIGYSLCGYTFNQGSLTAFILVSALTCSSVFYIINDYIYIKKNNKSSSIKAYMKAYNKKIKPIIWSYLSISIAFLPFIFNKNNYTEYWISLAIGLIFGNIFSIIGLHIFIPLLLIKNKSKHCIIKNK